MREAKVLETSLAFTRMGSYQEFCDRSLNADTFYSFYYRIFFQNFQTVSVYRGNFRTAIPSWQLKSNKSSNLNVDLELTVRSNLVYKDSDFESTATCLVQDLSVLRAVLDLKICPELTPLMFLT